jgi:hypothetical protein
MERKCLDCGGNISPGRIKAIPTVKYCVKCADKHDTTVHDVDSIVAKSPTSTRNGFGISE